VRRYEVPARPATIPVAFSVVILIEAAVIHLWLHAKHPVAAWVVTLSSLATIWFIVSDMRGMRSAHLGLDDDALDVALGGRVRVRVPRSNVERVAKSGLKEMGGYDPGLVNGTKPDTPNVVITFREPVEVRLLGVSRKKMKRLAVRLAAPEEFLAAMSASAE
jgi:hypothetical protein